MGWWQVNADTLASSRFVVSPLAETVASLKVLERGVGTHPGERVWLEAHRGAYRRWLAQDPVAARILWAALRPTWNADYLTPTPEFEGEAGFAEEVARVRQTPPALARQDLAVALGGRLPADLERDDLPERTADVLAWVWQEAVLPTWPRRRRVIEADVVARTAQLSQGGWAAALDGMRPGMRWLGDSRLQVNPRDYPPRELVGARLMFVPVTPAQGWVTWDTGGRAAAVAPGTGQSCAGQCFVGQSCAGQCSAGESSGGRPSAEQAPEQEQEKAPEQEHGWGKPRYAVVYPCAGVLADQARAPVPEGLGSLLGAARAAVLVLLDSPKSTTQLVALTGQRLGSVGGHLRVLLDARLVQRRRAGRSVLYYRTGTGHALIRAQEDAGADTHGGPWSEGLG